MTEFEKYQLLFDAIKSASSIIIPVLLVMLGVMFHRYRKFVEHRFQHERETFARRFMNYQEITSLANDIYCFHALVGHFQDITPVEVVKKKRTLEALVFSNLPLWDDRFCDAITVFLNSCFETQRGRDTRIASVADLERHIESRGRDWDDSWRGIFLNSDDRSAYLDLLTGAKFSGSYRNDVLKPAYAVLLSSLSVSVGGELSTNGALRMLNPEK